VAGMLFQEQSSIVYRARSWKVRHPAPEARYNRELQQHMSSVCELVLLSAAAVGPV
jgi:hypothetical protein